MNQNINSDKEELKKLTSAIVLVTIMLFGVNMLFPNEQPRPVETKTVVENITSQKNELKVQNDQVIQEIPAEDVLKKEPINVKNEYVDGLFDVTTAGINQLSLLKYNESLEENSKNVQLLTPDYFTSLVWKSKEANMPGMNANWAGEETKIEPNKPAHFVYENEGVHVERTISIDDAYMFTIQDKVTNLKSEPIKVFQVGNISKKLEKKPTMMNVHEGFVGVLNDSLVEKKYTEAEEKNYKYSDRTQTGWFGFTDKYWQSILVLDKNVSNTISYTKENGMHKASFETDNITIQPNETITQTVRLFAGAKEIDLISSYQKDLNIPKFDLSIDFGWFRFLTQPFLHFLKFIYGLIGNMGVAIIVFATIIRLAMLPIATKSYESMAKMRKMQPKLLAIQRRFKNDRARLQIETMNLYKREKINPASGCLPLLLQIPIFFALYKVILISIDMRHAPFFGWIQDLSMPDPAIILTGFGYFDWPVPSILCIGIWPVLMGVTMYIQQKLSPAPNDKTQARMMQFLPIIFTFMLGGFAAGLVIYWTWSNLLSIIQQKYIMKKVGVS